MWTIAFRALRLRSSSVVSGDGFPVETFQCLVEQLVETMKVSGPHQFLNWPLLLGFDFYRHILNLEEFRPRSK
jgi:hypothetical protein